MRKKYIAILESIDSVQMALLLLDSLLYLKPFTCVHTINTNT